MSDSLFDKMSFVCLIFLMVKHLHKKKYANRRTTSSLQELNLTATKIINYFILFRFFSLILNSIVRV
jgi:hypothetical protein